jgi:serpin B
MVKILLCILVAAILLSTVAGCAPGAQADARSDAPREMDPAVPPADVGELVTGNSGFAFDLYQALRESEGNLFYSPHSISLALAMTYAGARAETEGQMADTLQFTLPQERLHPAWNALDQVLSSRGEGAAGKDGEGFRLNIVNAIWGQTGFDFLQAFLDTLAVNYGAGLRLLDFQNDPEGSRQTINDWVAEQTEGRIEDLIPAGAIDDLTRMVLTNAIYFNAAWRYPFDEAATQDGTFHLPDGGEVTVPMMRQTEYLGYAEGEGYQVVDLPYDGNELSMVLLVPDESTFAEFERSLDAGTVDGILGDLRRNQVALTMPKFEFDAKLGLANTLAAMGMPDAFSGSADFSGMTGERDLFISDVVHQAFVSVDEAGTEAAAATAVIMKLTSAPEPATELTVDRPFIFFIRDIETGAILFVGRVVDPSA